MYDYGARFYDPSISLWTSVDPLTGDMPDHGAYNYTFQNPIMFNDPTGMKGEGVDDWYRNNETGEIHWQQGSQEIEGHTNIGSEYIHEGCLLYTSPSPRDQRGSRMPSSA